METTSPITAAALLWILKLFATIMKPLKPKKSTIEATIMMTITRGHK